MDTFLVILLAFFIGGALIDLYSGAIAAVFAQLFGAVLPVLLLAAGMYGLGVPLPIGMAIAVAAAIVATLAIMWWRSERLERAEAQR